MKRFFQVVLLVFLSCTGLFAQQKYALVIGNGAYTGSWGKLGNPINDATDMEAALKSLGFQVVLLKNGTRAQMTTAIIDYTRKLGTSRNAYGFFYYAGHGAQDKNGINYLIPVNANTQSLNQLPDEAVSVRFILDEIEDAKNELNMIVLDACRNVPQSLDRSDTRGLAPVSKPPIGSIIMFATAAGKTASDGGSGRNGLFTSHLLKNIKNTSLNVTEVFMRTGSDVAKATNGEQYPETQVKYYETAYLSGKPQKPDEDRPPSDIYGIDPSFIISGISVPADMVLIKGGTFTMGSPSNEKERESEELQHQVTVSSFYMGNYEVTQKEYQEITGINPSEYKGDNLPVEVVSWYDAIEYCNKRSQKEGLTPAYTINKNQKDSNNFNNADDVKWTVTWNRNANGYRLPTEAEWEYACRAGTKTPFSTGNNITTNQANYDGEKPYNNNAKGEYRGKPTSVGSFAPNAWGLYDMHGNVYEWCWDWYGDYSSGSQTDPVGTSSGNDRVIRSGYWGNNAFRLRSACRDGNRANDWHTGLGFRVARSN